MYKVKRYFRDLQDNNYAYNAGDMYPRKGVEVSPQPIQSLLTNQNAQGVALIEVADDKPEKKTVRVKAVVEETASYTEDDLNAMTKVEIENLADELGYSIPETNKAGMIEAFLAAQA